MSSIIEPREPTFMATVGMPGVGKTYQNIWQIRRVLAGNPAAGVKPQKVLIFDANDEYSNTNADVKACGIYIKSIHIDQVAAFSASNYIECCRIRPFDKGQPMDLGELSNALTKVMKFYRNGLLIAEDFKSFAGDSMKADLVSRLCTRRHSGADTLVSLQDIGLIAPKVWMNLKWLRLHMIGDLIIRYKDAFPGKIEYLSIAENIIRERFYTGTKENERFHLMIDLVKGFIYGKYNQAEFDKAARQYIAQNWKTTVGREMSHRDNEWNVINKDEKQAATIVLNRLAYSYSQFSIRLQKK